MDGERYYGRWEGVVLRNCNWRGRAVEWLGCESETTRQCPREHPSESTHTMMVGRSGVGRIRHVNRPNPPPGYALSVEEQKGSSICLS